jgi:hypothetical protein
VAALAFVEDLDVVEDRVGQFRSGFQLRRSRSSICIEDQTLSIMALSEPSPIDPNDSTSPADRIFSPKTHW